jgi:RNA polymerase sigma-70 factor (sigma-E family)
MSRHRTEFAAFYEAAKNDCLRTVLASVGDAATAEDLVAEAFARAWARWSQVRQHPAPRAWVICTALNANVSAWRRRRRELPLLAYDGPGRPCDGDGSVDRDLMAALQRLPERQRQVVALRIFLDLNTARTADMLGIAPGTVSAHLARAMAGLRAEFAMQQQGES